MLASGSQSDAYVDQPSAIHIEKLKGRTTYWSYSSYESEILAPCKMITPILSARIVKRNKFTCERIKGFDFCILVAIAGLAGKGEVVKCALALATAWNNMFCREGVYRMIFTALAVFAKITGAFCYGLLKSARNRRISHVATYPTAPLGYAGRCFAMLPIRSGRFAAVNHTLLLGR